MNLEPEHRKALLDELTKAQEDRDRQENCMQDAIKKDDTVMVQWFEVGAYLAQQRIYTIREAITANEIDN